jgi:hypothetical protein
MPTSQERLIAPDMQLTTIAEEEYENQIKIVQKRFRNLQDLAFLALMVALMVLLLIVLVLIMLVFLIGLSNFIAILINVGLYAFFFIIFNLQN